MRSDTPTEAIRRLAHDVGKYVARAARNIDDTPPAPPILEMLLEDLYALDGRHAASRVFETAAATLTPALAALPDITACRERLRRIDHLEGDVRAGRADAVAEAARLAVSVDDTLRRLVRQVAEGNLP